MKLHKCDKEKYYCDKNKVSIWWKFKPVIKIYQWNENALQKIISLITCEAYDENFNLGWKLISWMESDIFDENLSLWLMMKY